MSFITNPTISTTIITDQINVRDQHRRISYTKQEMFIISINVLGTTIINNNVYIFNNKINIQ